MKKQILTLVLLLFATPLFGMQARGQHETWEGFRERKKQELEALEKKFPLHSKVERFVPLDRELIREKLRDPRDEEHRLKLEKYLKQGGYFEYAKVVGYEYDDRRGGVFVRACDSFASFASFVAPVFFGPDEGWQVIEK